MISVGDASHPSAFPASAQIRMKNDGVQEQQELLCFLKHSMLHETIMDASKAFPEKGIPIPEAGTTAITSFHFRSLFWNSRGVNPTSLLNTTLKYRWSWIPTLSATS